MNHESKATKIHWDPNIDRPPKPPPPDDINTPDLDQFLLAPTRWCKSVHVSQVPSIDHELPTDVFPSDENDNTSDQNDCQLFPQGSLFDLDNPSASSCIGDFPYLTFNYLGDDSFPALTLNDTRDDHYFDDLLDEYIADVVVPIDCYIRHVGIPQDPTTVYVDVLTDDLARILRIDVHPELGKLADGGANVCLCGDKTKLVGVRTITPVPIGLACGDNKVTQPPCTEMGFLPMHRNDGSMHYQPMLINPLATDMILSPNSILQSSKDLISWSQVGWRDDRPGTLTFTDKEGNVQIEYSLEKVNGLYYTKHKSLSIDDNPVRSRCSVNAVKAFIDRECYTDNDLSVRDDINALQSILDPNQVNPIDENLIETTPCVTHKVAATQTDANAVPVKPPKRTPYRRRPVDPTKQLEAELWAARLGFVGEWQLSVIPHCADGLPNQLDFHPFRFIDHKEQARIRRQAAGRKVQRLEGVGQRFYVDFGFIRASNSDYSKYKSKDGRVIASYDGYNSYLAVVDEHSRHAWVYLSVSKEPPIEDMSRHLEVHGLPDGGILRCDQGGELARSDEFCTYMLENHNYKVEPTGADSPSQNGGVERFNETFAVTVRALLYGSSLPATYWSSALLHAVYLHNRRVHKVTKRTPFEAYYGKKPNLKHLKIFGSRVCVKRTGKRRSKLDRHDFSGIFLGYTATDDNIVYLDLDTGIVKTCHHAVFDEAWFSFPDRPPAAQLLYDLGLIEDSDLIDEVVTKEDLHAPYPPLPSHAPKTILKSPRLAIRHSLPLRLTETPRSVLAAAAAKVSSRDPYINTVLASKNKDGSAVEDYGITVFDVHQIYCSPHPYTDAFEQDILLRRYNHNKFPTGGLKFKTYNNRLILDHMELGSPGARMPRWRTCLRGAWLRKVGSVEVNSVSDVVNAFANITSPKIRLTFSHTEVKHGLSSDGIPQCNIDQLNPRHLFENFDIPPSHNKTNLNKIFDGDVWNFQTLAMKLTRGKLLKTDDWDEWQMSEYTQLDQYDKQKMFGEPVAPPDLAAVFNLVWTYVVKELDKRKKARCTCDGSTRAGQVRVLDHTYANCVDQTGSRLFYGISAAENKMVFGADVSNAFGEAPPPKQGFYIRPDKAFREWWKSKGRPPIPDGHVIPILAAMQGHPEAPRLWERHADKIIRMFSLTPTTHEPCLYSGIVNGERVLLMRQVDDFAVATDTEATANMLFDMIDDQLTFPLKRMGLITMFNGIDVDQTRDYIKISVQTYIERICEKHLHNWMNDTRLPTKPTPLPTRPDFLTGFLGAKGDSNDAVQAELAKKYTFGYRSGIGELIYAMITTRPDISYATVAAAQHSACPAEIHYNAVRHILKYLYVTRQDGLYFWRTEPNEQLPYKEPPTINSNAHDLLFDGRPHHDATDAHAYMDATWASCLKTRRSFGGLCIRFAGGTIAYKAWLQATVALSSTESEFISASDCGKVILYIRSILWDLGVPQDSATIAYEDNNACTAMANAQKPTTRTRHIDTRYFALCEWVERDLLKLERVDTSQNLADHFTKQLSSTLFHRHVDYIMGHVPPKYSTCYKYATELLTHVPKSTPSAPIITPSSAHTDSVPVTAAITKIVTKLSNIWTRIIY